MLDWNEEKMVDIQKTVFLKYFFKTVLTPKMVGLVSKSVVF